MRHLTSSMAVTLALVMGGAGAAATATEQRQQAKLDYDAANVRVHSQKCHDIPIKVRYPNPMTAGGHVLVADVAVSKDGIRRGTVRVANDTKDADTSPLAATASYRWCPHGQGLGWFRFGPAEVVLYDRRHHRTAAWHDAASWSVLVAQDSRVGVATTRLGRGTRLTATVEVYRIARSRWVRWANRPVQVRKAIPSRPSPVVARTRTGSRGVADVVLRKPGRYYLTITGQEPTSWGVRSRTVTVGR